MQDSTALTTPDVFRAEYSNGNLTWRAAPQSRFVAGSSRTFNLPIVVVNRDSRPLTIDAVYAGPTMESAARNIVVAPCSSTPIMLRAVETKIGPAAGKLSLRYGSEEIGTNVHFDIRPLVLLRARLLDERGRLLRTGRLRRLP